MWGVYSCFYGQPPGSRPPPPPRHTPTWGPRIGWGVHVVDPHRGLQSRWSTLVCFAPEEGARLPCSGKTESRGLELANQKRTLHRVPPSFLSPPAPAPARQRPQPRDRVSGLLGSWPPSRAARRNRSNSRVRCPQGRRTRSPLSLAAPTRPKAMMPVPASPRSRATRLGQVMAPRAVA